MSAALFLLIASAIGLAALGQRRLSVATAFATLVLAGYWLAHHANDPLTLSL